MTSDTDDEDDDGVSGEQPDRPSESDDDDGNEAEAVGDTEPESSGAAESGSESSGAAESGSESSGAAENGDAAAAGDETSTRSSDDAGDGSTTDVDSDGADDAVETDDDDENDTTAGRDPVDLTPDEVAVTRPDEFEFRHLPKDRVPADVQYTPEFDPDWVYPSGTKDGGTQDDVAVQGLELGVLATEDTLEAVVTALLEALDLYHEAVGEYPRHRIVDSAATFRDLTDGAVGLAAVFQPRPDDHDGLTDHMTSLQEGDGDAVDSNHGRANRLVQHLVWSLVHHDLSPIEDADESALAAITGWESPQRIGSTLVVERYGPLAATEVYDPTAGAVDISTDGVDSVTETDLSPTYLEVDRVEELF